MMKIKTRALYLVRQKFSNRRWYLITKLKYVIILFCKNLLKTTSIKINFVFIVFCVKILKEINSSIILFWFLCKDIKNLLANIIFNFKYYY